MRGGARSLSDLKLLELQRLAAESIGVKDLIRQRGLVLMSLCLPQESWSSPPFLVLYAQNDFSARVPL